MTTTTFRDLNHNEAIAIAFKYVKKYVKYANPAEVSDLLLTCGSTLVVFNDGSIAFRPELAFSVKAIMFFTTPLHSDRRNFTIIIS